MSEAIETVIETPAAPDKAPVKRKAKKAKAKRAKPAQPAAAKPAKPADDLAGISAANCPRACTADHCVISTVAVCKHPIKTADSGCGPVTMANRERARKVIKHQAIEAKG